MKKTSSINIYSLLVKSFAIILIFLSLGFFYNKNLESKFFITYQTEYKNEAQVYLNSVDNILVKLNLIKKNDEKTIHLIQHKLNTFGNDKIKKPKDVNSYTIRPTSIKFFTSSNNNLDEKVDGLIEETNRILRIQIKDMLDLYYSYAVQFIKEEMNFTIGQLNKMSNLKDQAQTEGLGTSSVQEKYFLEKFMNKIFNQNTPGLSASELVEVFNTFNITKNLENIQYMREVFLNTDPEDNIDLIRMKRLSGKLDNVEFIKKDYLIGVINQKPNMIHTLVASFLVGLFICFVYIYLSLLHEKKSILKRIAALRNQV